MKLIKPWYGYYDMRKEYDEIDLTRNDKNEREIKKRTKNIRQEQLDNMQHHNTFVNKNMCNKKKMGRAVCNILKLPSFTKCQFYSQNFFPTFMYAICKP